MVGKAGLPPLLMYQNVQLYVFIAVRACSVACLQAAANEGLVCGLSASFFHDVRNCSKAALYWARATSGTLPETQAS